MQNDISKEKLSNQLVRDTTVASKLKNNSNPVKITKISGQARQSPNQEDQPAPAEESQPEPLFPATKINELRTFFNMTMPSPTDK